MDTGPPASLDTQICATQLTPSQSCVLLHTHGHSSRLGDNEKAKKGWIAMATKVRDRKTRNVIAALYQDGWENFRNGPGDHVQFKHPKKSGKVTVDTGEPEIPTGTLRNIYRQAGWEW